MQAANALQEFVETLGGALGARVEDGTPEAAITATVFGSLKPPLEPRTLAPVQEGPWPELLASALEPAKRAGGDLSALAAAFERLEPHLAWTRGRRGMKPGDPVDLHATIVGPEGLAQRTDAWIGVSLLAPHREYVDHHHPPPEVYLVLSPGEWRRRADPWFEPGVGGTVYNEPDVLHNMRSGNAPLFAFWCLPLG